MHKFRQTSGPQYFGSAQKSNHYPMQRVSLRPIISIQDQDPIAPSNHPNWLLRNGKWAYQPIGTPFWTPIGPLFPLRSTIRSPIMK